MREVNMGIEAAGPSKKGSHYLLGLMGLGEGSPHREEQKLQQWGRWKSRATDLAGMRLTDKIS